MPRGWASAGLLALLALAGWGGWRAWSDAAERREVAVALTGGVPERAAELMRRHGCGGCHAIPGLAGADGRVGPALIALRQRVLIGGNQRNTGETLVRWLVDPRALRPDAGMPPTGLTEAGARDVAAWLYSR
ncbi:hypothetical protein BKE38_11705 [Pseudoroseomonas deserti]|uniref:Cytochrome c domain-containing protein n=1 Tax=Teichococcus deserti TaxID=1817963 RepID=A0A1V2H4U8_9PROT|nr:c-type cytochrome [Pseudoroseomonas deserti]ONG53553.1 hypothetical protein BKE38_11705 [Pseudoroseomonas deserti]